MSRRERSRRRPLLAAGVAVVALALLLLYFQCAEGLGFGPGGADGTAEKKEQAAEDRSQQRPLVPQEQDSEPRASKGGRCQLRLDASGLTVDSRPADVAEAVRACVAAGGADLTTTGDAVFGELERLRDALDQAGVPLFAREAPAP